MEIVSQLLRDWGYVVVFFMAATPMIGIIMIIPIAITMGLSPFWVVIISFVGKALPSWMLIVIYEKIVKWREECKRRKNTGHENQTEQPEIASKRRGRARKVWDRYGLPGLFLLAPAITGIYLAIVMALAFKSQKMLLAIWMTISLAVWSIGLGVLSFYGLSLFGWFTRGSQVT